MSNYALMFAVNSYHGAPLNGCLNDQDDIIKMWKDLGIDILVNAYREEEVTHDKVLKTIANHAAILKAGDTLTIHWSGHGSSVPDSNGDEDDGRDEALVPYDFIPILDDELRAALSKFDPGVDILVLLDSCYSGTMTRAALLDTEITSRFFPLFPHRKDEPVSHKKELLKADYGNWTLISGSGSHQTSADAWISGRYNGAFSYYMMKAYKKGQSKQQLYEQIRKHLPSAVYAQSPQLEGNEEWMRTGCFGVPFDGSFKRKECFLKRWFGRKDRPIEPPKPPNPPPPPDPKNRN